MVAVLLVFAQHLWGWPRGGFIGVDVFFVISGFLITGNLLRMAEARGNISFRKFYLRRIRRIVPAATLVLLITVAASFLAFQPFRAQQVGLDAVFAFVFMSNWWFASRETNYFAADSAVSPIQHYWSLSIEEQFYFVWPGLIFVIGVLVASKTWTHDHRMRLAGRVMAAVIAVSFAWALYQTQSAPTWAYFDTLSRVWELGVGALLAASVGALTGIPVAARPYLSWAGLSLIGVGALTIVDGSAGFPAPWALLPVAGSALVIAAGVHGEPHQPFLQNQVAVYVGNISYSLYLVHWPVIVILGSLTAVRGSAFSVAVIAIAFGLAIGSFHFIENPFRYGSLASFQGAFHKIRKGRYETQRSSRNAALAVLVSLCVGLTAYVLRPAEPVRVPLDELAVARSDVKPLAEDRQPSAGVATTGPLAAALQQQIVEALKATSWPALDPSIESAIKEPGDLELGRCAGPVPPGEGMCTWGAESAAVKVVLVGDSIALNYAGPLRDIALGSGGAIRLHVEAMAGCQFSNDWIFNPDPSVTDACPARKQHTVDVINSTKPDVVIISGSYGLKRRVGTDEMMAPTEWAEGLRQIVEKFRASTKKIVFLAAPPADKNIADCYSGRSSIPGDCVSEVTSYWASNAEVTHGLADSLGGAGAWIDSRPFFCSDQGWCPAFVGSTPTKRDAAHMTEAYAEKIRPVIQESLTSAGVIPG